MPAIGCGGAGEPFAGAVAGPAMLDFEAEAAARGRRSLANFSVLRLAGVNAQLVTGDNALVAMHEPFLAAAGLGVKRAVAPWTSEDTSGPAGVSRNQTLQVAFFNAAMTAYRPLAIGGLTFRDACGRPIGPGGDVFIRIMTDKGTVTDSCAALVARAARRDPFFSDTRFVLFGFVEGEFHVSAIGVFNPPASATTPLQRPDAGLGFAARRKMRPH